MTVPDNPGLGNSNGGRDTHVVDRIDRAASEWVVLQSDRDLTEDERRDFGIWLTADPRHRAAFDEFRVTWLAIAGLDGLPEPVAADNVPTIDDDRFIVRSRRLRGVVGALVAVAAAAVAAYVVPALLHRVDHYQTGVSRTMRIALRDGSQITLGPKSDLTVQFANGERRVVLAWGDAFFEVARDPAHPFYVDAGAAETRVLGTRFDVNRAHDTVRVDVEEGIVKVSRMSIDGPGRIRSVSLRAGQGAEVQLLGAAEPITLRQAQVSGAWRQGRLVYADDRLGDLVADVNRYYRPGVVVVDPSIANLRITASFKLNEIPAFMGAVGAVVPVQVTQLPDGSFRLQAVPSALAPGHPTPRGVSDVVKGD